MYTRDEYFHSQKDSGAFTLPGGEKVSSTHTFSFFDHMNCPKSEVAALLASATLFHKRKVFIKIKELELKNDRESHSLLDSENGDPPAEIMVEVEVRYNPFVQDSFGKNVLVHDNKLEYRSLEMMTQEEKTTEYPDFTVFEAPVFDGMSELQLNMIVLEVDWCKRFGIEEWIFDEHQGLGSFNGAVPLVNNEIIVESEYARIVLDVKVVEQY